MRKRLVQVVMIVALVLGLLTGSGLVGQAEPPAQLAALMNPYALMGGGSGT